MRVMIAVLGYLGVAGSVIGGLIYASSVGFLFGLLYLVLGCLVSVPFFGLASTMKVVEEQGETIATMREELARLGRKASEKAPLTFSAPSFDGRAPMVSGPRKLEEEPKEAKVEAPKIDLASIKPSDR